MPAPRNNRRNDPDFVESTRWEDNITEEEKRARAEFNHRKGQEQYYQAQYQKEKREEEERRRKANERSRGSTNYPVQSARLLHRWEQEEHIRHYPDEERKFWCLACKKGLANFDSAVQHICSEAHEQNAKELTAKGGYGAWVRKAVHESESGKLGAYEVAADGDELVCKWCKDKKIRSEHALEAHLTGKDHPKNLKWYRSEAKARGGDSKAQKELGTTGITYDPDGRLARDGTALVEHFDQPPSCEDNEVVCSLCALDHPIHTVNMISHAQGGPHQTKLRQFLDRNDLYSQKCLPKGVAWVDKVNGSMMCFLCNAQLNSSNLDSHVGSDNHAKRLANASEKELAWGKDCNAGQRLTGISARDGTPLLEHFSQPEGYANDTVKCELCSEHLMAPITIKTEEMKTHSRQKTHAKLLGWRSELDEIIKKRPWGFTVNLKTYGIECRTCENKNLNTANFEAHAQKKEHIRWTNEYKEERVKKRQQRGLDHRRSEEDDINFIVIGYDGKEVPLTSNNSMNSNISSSMGSTADPRRANSYHSSSSGNRNPNQQSMYNSSHSQLAPSRDNSFADVPMPRRMDDKYDARPAPSQDPTRDSYCPDSFDRPPYQREASNNYYDHSKDDDIQAQIEKLQKEKAELLQRVNRNTEETPRDHHFAEQPQRHRSRQYDQDDDVHFDQRQHDRDLLKYAEREKQRLRTEENLDRRLQAQDDRVRERERQADYGRQGYNYSNQRQFHEAASRGSDDHYRPSKPGDWYDARQGRMRSKFSDDDDSDAEPSYHERNSANTRYPPQNFADHSYDERRRPAPSGNSWGYDQDPRGYDRRPMNHEQSDRDRRGGFGGYQQEY